MRIIWTLLLLALLTSCTNINRNTTPNIQIPWEKRQTALMQLHSWDVSGKIGVITAQNSGSASLKWIENNDSYTIDLSGPLGAGALSLTGQPGKVTLRMASGQTLSAPTPEQLLAQAWGWQLPVSYLKYWVRGLAVPDLAAQKEFDTAGRLSKVAQQDWQVSYSDYTNVGQLDLPGKITIQSPAIKIKLAIHHWQINH